MPASVWQGLPRVNKAEFLHKHLVAVSILGWAAYYQGDYEKAARLAEEALALARDSGYKRGIGINFCLRGRIAQARGDLTKALALHKQGLAVVFELHEEYFISQCLEGIASVAVACGQFEKAARLFGAADGLRETARIPRPPADRPMYNKDVAAICAGMPKESLGSAWAEGRAMTLEQAIEYALENEPT